MNDCNSTNVTINPIGSTTNSENDFPPTNKKSILNIKPFLCDLDNKRHIYTIGNDHMKKKQHHKICQNCTWFRYLILAFVLILLIAAVIAVLVTLTVSKTTTTTTTTLASIV